MDFFFLRVLLSAHMWLHMKYQFFPIFFTSHVELGLFSVYTKAEDKFEEGKRVTGPIILAVYGFLLPFPLIRHCPP